MYLRCYCPPVLGVTRRNAGGGYRMGQTDVSAPYILYTLNSNRVLLFYKSHHCPAVILGIIDVTQAVQCCLFFQYIHILGVESADEYL